MAHLPPIRLNRRGRFVFQVLVIFLPVALIFCAGAYYVYYNEQNRAATQNREREAAAVEIGQNVISVRLQEIKGNIDFVSNDYGLKNFLDRGVTTELRNFEQNMLNFSASSRIYDQIRWLDETGMERVRVNFNNGNPTIVPIDELQNKRARFYFQAASKLKHGEVYISPFDLNIEHDRIEIPHKPMLRIAAPVFDSHHIQRGIVILNYLGIKLLARFNKATAEIADHVMLLNQEGYWLKSPKPEEEWGFMFGHDQLTLAQRHPAAWNRILAEDNGQFEDNGGLWTFNTLFLVPDKQKTTGHNSFPDHTPFWKVVAYLPQHALYGNQPLLMPLLAVLSTLLMMLFFISWKLAHSRHLQNEALDLVLHTNQNLENLVQQRTEALTAETTERYRTEQALRATEMWLESILASITDVIWSICAQTHKLQYLNAAVEGIYGRPQSDFFTNPALWFEVVYPSDRELITQYSKNLFAGVAGSLEYRIVKPNGEVRWLYDRTQLVYDADGTPLRIDGITSDITERKRLEHRFRQAVESAPNAIVMVDGSGTILMVNVQTEASFGYSRTELVGQPVEVLVPERFRGGHASFRRSYFAAPQTRPMGAGRELYGLRKDGSEFPVEIGLSLIDSHEETLVLSSIVDITQRKQAEVALKSSESALKETQHLAGLGGWKWDIRTDEHFWSEEIYRIFGRDPALPPAPYPEVQQYFTPASWVPLADAVEKGLAEGVPYECDAEVVRADGSRRWIVARGIATRDDTQNVIILHGTVQDITERKNASDKLKEALNEKEMLLKEVYHRVKNNLQVVSSLINLQARNVKNVAAADLLKQSADRIKSMALLHEKLYQSKDLARIDFNDYIHSLVAHLLFGYGAHSGKIDITIKIGDVFLDVDTAIPCGLIINELLSNALKHAFPGDRHGEIGVNFTQDQGESILVITDNGIGFSTDVDFKKTDSLGLQLVATLTNQLMGQITLNQAEGSTFTIRFSNIS
jgi:PAS domain S-box-containing protein